MSLTNEEKAMLERLWIGIARQMDDEFQRVLEDLRGMCDTANSFAARLPNSRAAHDLVTMRLNEWHAHFTKYLEVASAHPLGTSLSYVETLTRVIKGIEEARESIKGAQGRGVRQLRRSVSPRSRTANEQGGPAGGQQPPAAVARQDKDPLLEIARMREQEQREIAEDLKKTQERKKQHMEKMQEMRKQHSNDLDAIRKNRRW